MVGAGVRTGAGVEGEVDAGADAGENAAAAVGAMAGVAAATGADAEAAAVSGAGAATEAAAGAGAALDRAAGAAPGIASGTALGIAAGAGAAAAGEVVANPGVVGSPGTEAGDVPVDAGAGLPMAESACPGTIAPATTTGLDWAVATSASTDAYPAAEDAGADGSRLPSREPAVPVAVLALPPATVCALAVAELDPPACAHPCERALASLPDRELLLRWPSAVAVRAQWVASSL